MQRVMTPGDRSRVHSWGSNHLDKDGNLMLYFQYRLLLDK